MSQLDEWAWNSARKPAWGLVIFGGMAQIAALVALAILLYGIMYRQQPVKIDLCWFLAACSVADIYYIIVGIGLLRRATWALFPAAMLFYIATTAAIAAITAKSGAIEDVRQALALRGYLLGLGAVILLMLFGFRHSIIKHSLGLCLGVASFVILFLVIIGMVLIATRM